MAIRRVYLVFIWSFLFGFLFIGCRAPKLGVSAIQKNDDSFRIEPSVIHVYADLEVSKLEQLLNAHLDTLIYQDSSFTDHQADNLKIKAKRAGRVKLRYDQNTLHWELPLEVAFKKRFSVMGYQIPVGDEWEYTGQIMLRYSTSLTIRPDWTLSTHTVSGGYSWIRKPAVKIGAVDIPVTFVANFLLPAYLQTFSKTIDEVVGSFWNVPTFAQQGWNMLFTPLRVPGDREEWLSINPRKVSLMPIEGSNGHVRIGGAVTAEVSCLLEHPPVTLTPTKLPSPEPLQQFSDTFKVNLLTDIPYTTIEKIVRERTADSTYVINNKKLKFESFKISGTRERMVVETKVSGSYRGTLVLTGYPLFEPRDKTLRIKDLKFDLKTSNLLVRSAKWLFNDRIERTIAQCFAIPLRDDLTDIEKQMGQFIGHYPLRFGFELNGKLSGLSLTSIDLTAESVKANLVFWGKLSLVLNEENLAPGP